MSEKPRQRHHRGSSLASRDALSVQPLQSEKSGKVAGIETERRLRLTAAARAVAADAGRVENLLAGFESERTCRAGSSRRLQRLRQDDAAQPQRDDHAAERGPHGSIAHAWTRSYSRCVRKRISEIDSQTQANKRSKLPPKILSRSLSLGADVAERIRSAARRRR